MAAFHSTHDITRSVAVEQSTAEGMEFGPCEASGRGSCGSFDGPPILQDSAREEPSKPSKPGSDGFVGSLSAASAVIGSPGCQFNQRC